MRTHVTCHDSDRPLSFNRRVPDGSASRMSGTVVLAPACGQPSGMKLSTRARRTARSSSVGHEKGTARRFGEKVSATERERSARAPRPPVCRSPGSWARDRRFRQGHAARVAGDRILNRQGHGASRPPGSCDLPAAIALPSAGLFFLRSPMPGSAAAQVTEWPNPGDRHTMRRSKSSLCLPGNRQKPPRHLHAAAGTEGLLLTGASAGGCAYPRAIPRLENRAVLPEPRRWGGTRQPRREFTPGSVVQIRVVLRRWKRKKL